MTNTEDIPPLGRIQDLLARRIDPNADFDQASQQMHALNLAVHEYMAQILTPYVNKHLATAPQNSETERRTLADSVCSALRHLGIAFRFGDTGKPAYLRVVHSATSRYAPNGDFVMDLLDVHGGRQRQTCSHNIAEATFYPVSLMPIPDQYALWSDRLHTRSHDGKTRAERARSWRNKSDDRSI